MKNDLVLKITHQKIKDFVKKKSEILNYQNIHLFTKEKPINQIIRLADKFSDDIELLSQEELFALVKILVFDNKDFTKKYIFQELLEKFDSIFFDYCSLADKMRQLTYDSFVYILTYPEQLSYYMLVLEHLCSLAKKMPFIKIGDYPFIQASDCRSKKKIYLQTLIDCFAYLEKNLPTSDKRYRKACDELFIWLIKYGRDPNCRTNFYLLWKINHLLIKFDLDDFFENRVLLYSEEIPKDKLEKILFNLEQFEHNSNKLYFREVFVSTSFFKSHFFIYPEVIDYYQRILFPEEISSIFLQLVDRFFSVFISHGLPQKAILKAIRFFFNEAEKNTNLFSQQDLAQKSGYLTTIDNLLKLANLATLEEKIIFKNKFFPQGLGELELRLMLECIKDSTQPKHCLTMGQLLSGELLLGNNDACLYNGAKSRKKCLEVSYQYFIKIFNNPDFQSRAADGLFGLAMVKNKKTECRHLLLLATAPNNPGINNNDANDLQRIWAVKQDDLVKNYQQLCLFSVKQLSHKSNVAELKSEDKPRGLRNHLIEFS